MFSYPRLSRVIGTVISRCWWCYWFVHQRIVFATGKTKVTQYVSCRTITCQSRLWSQRVRRSTGHNIVKNRYSNRQRSKLRQIPCQAQPTENTSDLSAPRRCHWVRTTVSTFWSAANISESELNATEKTVLCFVYPTMSSNVTQILAIGRLHEGNLCDTLNHMAPSNVKTVHQTSLLQTQLPRTVIAYPRPVFSAAKRINHASISVDQQAHISQVRKYCREKEN